jgi:hypothetical protein
LESHGKNSPFGEKKLGKVFKKTAAKKIPRSGMELAFGKS